MVCTKKPLLVLIVESRGFFGSANNASCLDNAFVSLHLRIPPRVLHFSAFCVYTCVVYVMCVCVLHTVDSISLSESEFTVEEGSKEVLINITRTGKLVDDIIVKFVAREIPSAINPAIRKIFALLRERAQRRGMCARVF